MRKSKIVLLFVVIFALYIFVWTVFANSTYFENLSSGLNNFPADRKPLLYITWDSTSSSDNYLYSSGSYFWYKYYCNGKVNLMVENIDGKNLYQVGGNFVYWSWTLSVQSQNVTWGTWVNEMDSIQSNAYTGVFGTNYFFQVLHGESRPSSQSNKFWYVVFKPQVSDWSTTSWNKIWFDFIDSRSYSTTNTYATVSYPLSVLDTNSILKYSSCTSDGWCVANANELASGWVKWAIFDVYAWPCDADGKAPTITLPNRGAGVWWTYFMLNSTGYFHWTWMFTWLILDKDASKSWNYWFSGAQYSITWLWYQKIQWSNSSASQMDNQMWVNSGTIKVYVSCPTCTWGWFNREITALTMVATGWTQKLYTWDSHDRWYTVAFNITGLELEVPFSITLSGSDNPNEAWDTHTGTQTFNFNTSTKPTFEWIANNGNTGSFVTGNVFPSKDNEYVILVKDNPAWINSGTIRVEFAGANYTGHVLTGTKLHISPSYTGRDTYWTSVYNVHTGYYVTFKPEYDLPESGAIQLRVYAEDFVWNADTWTFNLTVRQPCSQWWGCRNPLAIFHSGENLSVSFTGAYIQIVSKNPGTVVLSGDTLYCGKEWTWTTLYGTWNVKPNLYEFGNGSIANYLSFETGANEVEVTWYQSLNYFRIENDNMFIME